MVKLRRELSRASLLLVAVLFINLWILVNSKSYLLASFIYIAIPFSSLFLYGQWNLFGNKEKLEGIDNKWFGKWILGMFVGGIILFFGNVIPGIGVIGIPQVQSIVGTASKFLIIVISAPIAEELFFRDIMHDFFESKLKTPFFFSAIFASLVFAFYHYTAYGGSLSSASGSFLSAFVMGVVFSYENKFSKSNAVNIGTHMILNLWIGFVTLNIIGL